MLLVAIFSGGKKPQQAAAEEPVYTTVEECKAGRDAAECETAFAKAKEKHEEAAPRYAERAKCEDIYGPGQCVPRHNDSGGDSFTPLMMGFMLGHMLSGPAYQPVYITRERTVYAGSSYVGSYSGNSAPGRGWSGGSVAIAPSSPIARGGMGSTAGSAASGTSTRGGSSTVTSPRPSTPSPSATTSPSVSRGGFGSSASSAASSSAGS